MSITSPDTAFPQMGRGHVFVYLAGPMRGKPLLNHPLFNAAANYLRSHGFVVFNPAEADISRGENPANPGFKPRELATYMAIDLPEVCQADIIVLLPDWEKSEGTAIELAVARKLKKQILTYNPTAPWGERMTRITMTNPPDSAPTPLPTDSAPTPLPTDSKARKAIPMASGLLDYFPAALAEIAKVSFAGNEQHNPGEPLHWSRGKSNDHADTILRHLTERGSKDSDGQRHSAKMAWRALALLQLELEAEGAPMARGAKPAPVDASK